MPEQPEDRELSARYRKIPREHSPPELDRSILDQARAQAPQRRPRFPGWAPLASAVAVVGLALGLSLVIQDPVYQASPEGVVVPEEAVPAAPAALMQERAAASAAAKKSRSEEVDTALESPEDAAARRRSQHSYEFAAPPQMQGSSAADSLPPPERILQLIEQLLDDGELQQAAQAAELFQNVYGTDALPERIRVRLEQESGPEVE